MPTPISMFKNIKIKMGKYTDVQNSNGPGLFAYSQKTTSAIPRVAFTEAKTVPAQPVKAHCHAIPHETLAAKSAQVNEGTSYF